MPGPLPGRRPNPKTATRLFTKTYAKPLPFSPLLDAIRPRPRGLGAVDGHPTLSPLPLPHTTPQESQNHGRLKGSHVLPRSLDDVTAPS